MITIFNRRELLVTFSMEKQAELRERLKENRIDYSLKVVNRSGASVLGSSRARFGTFGQNMKLAYEYVFYVHKNDYDRAVAVMRGNL